MVAAFLFLASNKFSKMHNSFFYLAILLSMQCVEGFLATLKFLMIEVQVCLKDQLRQN